MAATGGHAKDKMQATPCALPSWRLLWSLCPFPAHFLSISCRPPADLLPIWCFLSVALPTALPKPRHYYHATHHLSIRSRPPSVLVFSFCCAANGAAQAGTLVSRHRSSVGLRWPSKRIAALHRLPIQLGMGKRCALRCAPMAARSLRHLIRDATRGHCPTMCKTCVNLPPSTS